MNDREARALNVLLNYGLGRRAIPALEGRRATLFLLERAHLALGGRGLTPAQLVEAWPLDHDALAARPRSGIEITERELDVLHGIADGWSNAEIGALLGITTDTAKTHLHRLYRKLGARSRAHAVALACRLGILRCDEHRRSLTLVRGPRPLPAVEAEEATS